MFIFVVSEICFQLEEDDPFYFDKEDILTRQGLFHLKSKLKNYYKINFIINLTCLDILPISAVST
jgi:hypothetical protein